MEDFITQIKKLIERVDELEKKTGAVGGAGVDTGTIVAFPTDTPPTGYLLCDGASLLRASYSALFTLIGTTYGSADGTHFNVPNIKGKVIVGKDTGQTEFDVLGETGGAKTHTLQTTEMPTHTHAQDAHTHTQNAHSHYLQYTPNGKNITLNGGGAEYNLSYGTSGATAEELGTRSVTATNQNTTPTNQNTGGGGAHNNLQPYIVLQFMIKT